MLLVADGTILEFLHLFCLIRKSCKLQALALQHHVMLNPECPPDAFLSFLDPVLPKVHKKSIVKNKNTKIIKPNIVVMIKMLQTISRSKSSDYI